MTARCPERHPCRPARAPSCMVGSGYFWCGKCRLYYPPMKVLRAVTPATTTERER